MKNFKIGIFILALFSLSGIGCTSRSRVIPGPINTGQDLLDNLNGDDLAQVEAYTFMHGAVGGMVLILEVERPNTALGCFPTNKITMGDLGQLIQKYLNLYPQHKQKSAEFVIYRALKTTCGYD